MEASPHQTCLQELLRQTGHVQSLFAAVYVHLIIGEAETLWSLECESPAREHVLDAKHSASGRGSKKSRTPGVIKREWH